MNIRATYTYSSTRLVKATRILSGRKPMRLLGVGLVFCLCAVSSPSDALGQRVHRSPLSIDLLARYRDSVAAGFVPLPADGWSFYDHSDSVLIRARVDTTASRAASGVPHLLVRVSLRVRHLSEDEIAESGGVRANSLQGAVWLPPTLTFWAPCSRSTTASGGNDVIQIGYFSPDSMLGQLRVADPRIELLSAKIEVLLVRAGTGVPVRYESRTRVVVLSMAD